MRDSHFKVLLILSLAVSLGILGTGFYFSMVPVGGTLLNRLGFLIGHDFGAFYTASQMAAQGNFAGVYDQAAFNAATQEIGPSASGYLWSYPPLFLFFVAPLAALPFVPALAVWSLLPFGVAVWILYRIYPHWLTVPMAAFSPVLGHNFMVGQTAR